MGATPIQSPLTGEDLIGIEPELLQQVDPGWRRRLSLFTGRALSDTALDNEQAYRSGRLALLGQSVTAGTVSGLELALNLTPANPLLTVRPGYGILANGEDVTLLSTLSTALSTLPVLDATGKVASAFKDFATANTVGILVLQPVVVQLNGVSLDTAPSSQLVSGNLDASCDQDPSEYAFQDLEIVDGCRLALVPWPTGPGAVPLPAPAINMATWRNRIAYAVFSAETTLQPDESFAWELLGLPLAVIAFDAAAKPLFVDRYSVVRQGGLPRNRYVLPLQQGLAQPIQLVQAALAQARVAQLAEQLVQTQGLTQISADFALLPPAGVLPTAAVDFVHKRIPWFPANWTVKAGPVHFEELESVLQTGMTAEPLDVTKSESVELLVPLPDSLYDPRILVTEVIDPQFQTAIDQATLARNITLQHRKDVQLAANALITADGQLPINIDAGLTDDEKKVRDGAVVYQPVPADAYGTSVANGVYTSNDLQKILTTAAAGPYTINIPNTNPVKTITLFNPDDIAGLTQHGVQHFIDSIHAKLRRADDLINLAFLNSQTDIYRFRQSVLNASDATRLATSPILANIATGDSAAATAQNISTYFSNVAKPAASFAIATTESGSSAAPAAGLGTRSVFMTQRSAGSVVERNLITGRAPVKDIAVEAGLGSVPDAPLRGVFVPTRPVSTVDILGSTSTSGLVSTSRTGSSIAGAISGNKMVDIASQLRLTETVSTASLTANQVAGTVDIQGQQPIVGAQLNIRTLTIAERLKQSPSQEGLFYAIGNRLNITNLLLDLEITVDDLQFLVDSAPAGTPTPSPTPTPIKTQPHFLYELRDTQISASIYSLMTTPHLDDNSDEAGLFSSGVRVLDQHTQLLRAVEGRIQQYRDFLDHVCIPALASIQSNLSQAQSVLTGLGNDLDQERQNLAFTTALLTDETSRVNSVKAQRTAILTTAVQLVAYTRPRTVVTVADTPSRQLVPGNIASPAPACLAQPVSVPPELREIVSLLREAPLSWFPSAAGLIHKIERPSLLTELISATRSRAAFQLQQPLVASSAASSSGVYAPVISSLYSSNQKSFVTMQTQRAAIQPAQFASLSWRAQVEYLKPVAAIADLVSTSIIHAEIANAVARLVQQISGVATCLYTRVGLTLPVDRLQWAEYLRGSGLKVQLNSLAILPAWNSQTYISRQQMQLLVDWLFQQIDQSNSAAVAYISDVIRVCILLASHAPVGSVIAGAVSGRILPVIGNHILLSSLSDRVAQGMSVLLYQSGQLTAEGVVSDMDSSSVTATIIKIYQPNVFLEDQAVAHFTAQSSDFAALKAFSR